MEDQVTDILATLSEALKCAPEGVAFLIKEQANRSLGSAIACLVGCLLGCWSVRKIFIIGESDGDIDSLVALMFAACIATLVLGVAAAVNMVDAFSPALALLDRVT